ncbi:GntR family transcriptional regulator [Burkholderia sp. Ac-20353]|uniref:GntR family transcriptional regulator n=1 Tax=Burkholderia sp. Ac-20353 TaxID=2703894 RepID=UPI00197B2E43|nr:GntR family transcriptional regulator [Burkholderia sp. Ac-20353]MBN3791185.1 GntR family transcriptional regulator [Burkholderia sp. Ac-20353]
MTHIDTPPPDTRTAASPSQTVRALLGLRELIVGGELGPGERISELWVVERLGVSRTPVRAALIRLQEEGLIEPIPTGGFAIRAFSAREIGDAIELRGTLEGLAARFAAERGVAPPTLRALHACADEIDTLLAGPLTDDTFSRYVDANARFHRLLACAAGSDVVARQIDKVATLPFASASAFVVVQSLDPRARETLVVAQAQHRAVLDAIERRQGARAEALMREHAQIAHDNLKRVLDNQRAIMKLAGGNLIRRDAG